MSRLRVTLTSLVAQLDVQSAAQSLPHCDEEFSPRAESLAFFKLEYIPLILLPIVVVVIAMGGMGVASCSSWEDEDEDDDNPSPPPSSERGR